MLKAQHPQGWHVLSAAVAVLLMSAIAAEARWPTSEDLLCRADGTTSPAPGNIGRWVYSRNGVAVDVAIGADVCDADYRTILKCQPIANSDWGILKKSSLCEKGKGCRMRDNNVADCEGPEPPVGWDGPTLDDWKCTQEWNTQCDQHTSFYWNCTRSYPGDKVQYEGHEWGVVARCKEGTTCTHVAPHEVGHESTVENRYICEPAAE